MLKLAGDFVAELVLKRGIHTVLSGSFFFFFMEVLSFRRRVFQVMVELLFTMI